MGGGDARPLLRKLPLIQDFSRCSACHKQLRCAVAECMALFCCFLAAVGCDGRNAGRGRGRALRVLAAQESQRHFLLDANPARINMGEVAQGSCKDADFTLTNWGTRTIELARIDTSCPCLTVDVPPRIFPGEQVEGRAKLDLRDEPNFTGDLAIEIRGWISAGEEAFLVVVAVRVPGKSER
jgi:hypothetical protein